MPLLCLVPAETPADCGAASLKSRRRKRRKKKRGEWRGKREEGMSPAAYKPKHKSLGSPWTPGSRLGGTTRGIARCIVRGRVRTPYYGRGTPTGHPQHKGAEWRRGSMGTLAGQWGAQSALRIRGRGTWRQGGGAKPWAHQWPLLIESRVSWTRVPAEASTKQCTCSA